MNIKRYRHEIEFLALLVFVLVIWYFGRGLKIDTYAIEHSLSGIPVFLSTIIYILFYVVITFFIFFSKDVFWVAGAVLFGVYLSTFLICIAEIINAFILFYLARRFGRAYVEKRVPDKYRHLDERLGNINFIWLFIFRAAPLIPYRFMDLGAGLTKINFRRYLLAVILGSPVKMFWIQYIIYHVGRRIWRQPYVLVEYFLSNKLLMALSVFYIILVVAAILKLNLENKNDSNR